MAFPLDHFAEQPLAVSARSRHLAIANTVEEDRAADAQAREHLRLREPGATAPHHPGLADHQARPSRASLRPVIGHLRKLNRYSLAMDPNVTSSIIGALSGIASAFITAKLTSGAVKKQAERSAAINAAYLTTQIAPALRAYAAACISVSYDDGEIEGRPAGANDFCEPTVTAPTFKPSEYDVDWKALPPALMAEVLTFPEKAQDATNGLDARDLPPLAVPFITRKSGVARLIDLDLGGC